MPFAASAWASPGSEAAVVSVPDELIVLLAPAGRGAPVAEDVVARGRRGSLLPAGLGAGNPQKVELGVTGRAQGAARERLQADPDGPEARLERYIVLTYPSGTDLESIKKLLRANPHVQYVQENRLFSFSVTPSDPLMQNQASGLPLAPSEYQWGTYLLNLPAAWDYAKGHSYVGVLDGGLAVAHEDLKPFNGSTYVGGNFRAHFSYDFGDADSDVDEIQGTTKPNAGHGTHVSGIIAATADNGTGTAGTCWHCSLMMAKMLDDNKGFQIHEQDVVDALRFVIENGAQVVNMSFGRVADTACSSDAQLSMFCSAVELAERRDLVLVAASGNSRQHLQFPANDSRFIAVGGLEPVVDGNGLGAVLWDEEDDGGCPSEHVAGLCPGTDPDCECGSNFTVNLNRNHQTVVAPAADVLSTVYPGRQWNNFGCGANATPGDKYGLCTGTSMSAPFVTGIVGLLRSVNPLLTNDNVKDLLTSNADRASAWDPQYGYGIPNAAESVKDALGRAGGVVLNNRLTPLFSLYSSAVEDSFYTTVPQMAAAALIGSSLYEPAGPLVPGYEEYPGTSCQVGPCIPVSPTASVYLFAGERAPFAGAPPLVPLYRLSFKGTNPNNNANHRDTTYATDVSTLQIFKQAGYQLDGIEGYVYEKCPTEPNCVLPPGAVKLLRRHNVTRDDFAIFPESQLITMQNQGYNSTDGLAGVIGYVYPNADVDSDNVIDGFEGLIGSNPARADSDCDALSDGAEVLGFPAGDPLSPASGAGCVPPAASFTFSCAQLSCSFNASGSTDNVGIVSYAWTLGDSTSGSGITTSRTYAASGFYTVTLTVTDTHGLTASKTRSVSVNGDAPLTAEGFFTVPPCRILDTRNGTILTSGQPITVPVAGLCGIPASARAVSFNVTVVSPTGVGHLAFLPGNQSSSAFAQSTINFNPAMSPRANNAILRLATDGSGSLKAIPQVFATPGEVHLILDVHGYFSEDAAPAAGAAGPFGYQAVTPCRAADTRTSSPIATGTSLNFTVQGVCGVPAGASAAALNLVMFQPTAGGHATLFQAGAPSPVPTINFSNGTLALANGARTRLAAATPDVSVGFFSPVPGASAHAILDVFGYFAPGAPLKYRPVAGCRLVDTRFAEQGAPALAAGETRTFQVQGNCGIPVGAKAAMVNLVSVGAAGQGHLHAFAAGTAFPTGSALNFHPDQGNLANGVIVPLSTSSNDLAIRAGVSGTHVIVDVFGYFQ